MQPLRGPRTEAALDAAKLVFVISWVIGIPNMFFESHYPLWLRWVGRALFAIFAIAILIFAILHSREIIAYRRKQRADAYPGSGWHRPPRA